MIDVSVALPPAHKNFLFVKHHTRKHTHTHSTPLLCKFPSVGTLTFFHILCSPEVHG